MIPSNWACLLPIAQHHSSLDKGIWGAASVLTLPLHPQEAAWAGGGSGLDTALSVAQGSWRVGCTRPGQALQAAV